MREYSVIPSFRGPLAEYFAKFLAEKHALGFRYRTQAIALGALDRSLLESGDAVFSRSVVESWTAKRDGEQVTTHESRVSLTRELARFLQRQGIDAYVPPEQIGQRRQRSFCPYIFTAAEVQALMTAVEHIPSHRHSPHRHEVVPMIFRILSGCGLRLSELLPLRWREVDLDRGILVLRDAKGHQDRLVPMSANLTERVQRYARLAMIDRSPEAIAFPAPDGGRYSSTHIYALFRRALWAAGKSHGGRGRGPRLHDLRHTFAVHRLMDWYRTGVDIDASLPVLAAYMGHRTIRGTQHYLRLTAELYPDLVATLDARYSNVVPGKETV